MIIKNIYIPTILLSSICSSMESIAVNPNKITQSVEYKQFETVEPKLKNTMEFNTMTMEELIKENNKKILDQIYKSLR